MVVLSCLKDEEDDEEETEEETEDISEGETEATESVIVEEDDDEWIEEERQSGDGEVRKDLDHLLFLIGFWTHSKLDPFSRNKKKTIFSVVMLIFNTHMCIGPYCTF